MAASTSRSSRAGLDGNDSDQRSRPKILLVTSSAPLRNAVDAMLDGLREHKRDDFHDVELGVVNADGRGLKAAIEAELAEGTFFAICSVANLEAFLSARRGRGLHLPFAVSVPSYDIETLDTVFRRDPFVRGIVRETVGDPEDIGQLAQLIKGEIRAYRARAGEIPSKQLKWKIDAEGRTETGQLVSLFADGVMRDFMQRLLHAVDSIRRDIPEPPLDADALWRAFRELQSVDEATTSRPDSPIRTLQTKYGPTRRGSISNPESILIEGESGVGKKVIAQWIARYLEKDLVRVSTVNIGRDLLESELFGSVRGGFTDAINRPGQLLLAWGNVVFLDEIGDLPLELQAKLLVYLDDLEFQPVGWGETWKFRSPVYIIAATNRDVRSEVAAGRFREDLYYRFRHHLRIPALRERKADLRPLIDVTLQNPSVNRDLHVNRIAIAALRRIEAHPFPGNVRELQSVLSDAVFRARSAGRRIILEEDVAFSN